MENARFLRSTAIWCAIGSLLSLVEGVIDFTLRDFVSTPGIVIPRHLVLLAIHVLMLAGMVGLARSGAVGNSVVGRIALGAALLGQSLFMVAELAEIVGAKNTSRMIYGIGSLLIILGMTATGVVVLLGKRWHGWHSWTPLLWGLYLLGVLPVAAALRGSAAALAIGLLGLPTLLLSVALWQEAGWAVSPALPGSATRAASR